MNISDLLEGKLITHAEVESGCIFLHIGMDETVVIMQPSMSNGLPVILIASADVNGQTLQ